jgi:hypothetical protein
VHKRALNAALSRIADCRDDSIAILGPTFSGSARSLSLALREWWARNRVGERNLQGRVPSERDGQCREGSKTCLADAESPIRIVSGTATSLNVTELQAVGDTLDGVGVVSFSTTVLPDKLALDTFVNEYLVGEHNVRLRDIALLVEANSAYGQSVRALGRHEDRTHDGSRDAILTLPFPMHIAEARSAVEKTRAGQQMEGAALRVVRPDLSVALDDGRQPRDLLPQMHPGMAGPAAEFALANLLATISRREIKYVGLIASDTRDKLFLAKQVRKYCPDVRLFTFESDLLYAHPDHREALSGMLVATTYPLFNRTQAWTTSPNAPRLQFPSSVAQGAYNAALVLLGHNAEWLMADYAKPRAWQPLRTPQEPRRFLTQRPILWVTAVGNGGLWPIKLYLPEPAERPNAWSQQVPFPAASERDYEDASSEQGSARSAVLVWAGLTLACLVQVVRYFAANRRRVPRRIALRWTGTTAALRRAFSAVADDVYRPRTTHRVEQLAYVVVCFGALAIAYGYWSYPFFANPHPIPLRLACPTIVGCLLALALVLVDALVGRGRWRGTRQRRHPYVPVRVAVFAAPVLLTIGMSALGSRNLLPVYDLDGMLAFERVTNLESQLSPLVPCLLVALAWFLLARGHLVRLALLRRPVSNMLDGDDSRGAVLAAAGRSATRAITQPWTRPLSIASALAWLVGCALIGVTFLPTFEGPWFDHLFVAGFLLASVLVVTAFAQALTLWLQIRRLLDRLAAHPSPTPSRANPPACASA